MPREPLRGARAQAAAAQPGWVRAPVRAPVVPAPGVSALASRPLPGMDRPLVERPRVAPSAEAGSFSTQSTFFDLLNPGACRSWEYLQSHGLPFSGVTSLPTKVLIGNVYTVPAGQVLVITRIENYLEVLGVYSQNQRIVPGATDGFIRFGIESDFGVGGVMITAMLVLAGGTLTAEGETSDIGPLGPHGLPEFARFLPEGARIQGTVTLVDLPIYNVIAAVSKMTGYLIDKALIEARLGRTS